jgi:glutamate/aspartate transport system substrate-binding protein
MNARLLKPVLLGIVACCLAMGAALAQDAAGVEKLGGTLKKIKDSRSIAIGYRDASVPFSYLNAAHQPVGYSIDICSNVVEAVRNALGDDTIQVKYVPVDTLTRIAAVVDGMVDLECGTTTNTAERQKQVAFSPIIFVSGTKLLVKRSAKFQSYRDFKGRTIAVTPASTNAAAIRSLSAKEHLDVNLKVVDGNAQAFDAVEKGEADAWAGDDAVLYATAAESGRPGGFKVLDEYLSYDPYGLMYRKSDPAFEALVRSAFEDMAASRELARIYDQWFLRKLPSGRTLGIAMSPQLESIFESLGQPTE